MDEKMFSVASPDNWQNDHIYAPRDTRKHSIAAERLLRCRPTFSKSLMVSVATSKLGCSPLFFVEPDVKVDGRYYRDVLLKQRMLPVVHRIAGDTYVFQQDSAPAHRTRDTVQLLQQETPEFTAPDLWPPNSPDPVGQLPCLGSHAGTKTEDSVTQLTSSSALLRLGRAFHKLWLTKPLTSGSHDYKPASKPRDITSSTYSNQPALFGATKRYLTTTGSFESHPHFI